MSYPEEYTDAYDDLILFRDKILEDLVGARVKALLDAGHDTMGKYKAQLDALGVEVTLFNAFRRRALVFKLHDKDLGDGGGYFVEGQYLQPMAKYPMFPPYLVTQRNLPQVDIFSYTARTEVDIKEMSGGAQLQGVVTLQVDSDDFLETPDAENALYDFYFLYPLIQRDAKFTPTDAMHGVQSWKGIGTQMVREIHRASDSVKCVFFAEMFFDAIVNWAVGDDSPVLVTSRFSPQYATPVTTLVLSQYRIHSDKKGIWMTLKGIVPSLGWFQVGTGLSLIEEEKVVWRNHFDVTISVNMSTWGTTVPAPNDYVYEADHNLIVTAYPEDGYEVDHWELDGVTVDTGVQYGFFVRKPCEIKVVFRPS